jgi:hypothetical protein
MRQARHRHLHGECRVRGTHSAFGFDKQTQERIAAKGDELAALLAKDRQHRIEIAIDDGRDLFSAFTSNTAQPLRHGRKDTDVGKEQRTMDKLPADFSGRRIAQHALDQERRQVRANHLQQSTQVSGTLLQQARRRRDQIELE